jgi:DNA-binding transcriptional regulator YhcF (GntR family)
VNRWRNRPAPVTALGTLDPDTTAGAAVQIADQLRAGILAGTFGPGGMLPSQPALAGHYQVARETAKRAIDILRGEHLVVSRQGAGTFVRTNLPSGDLIDTSTTAGKAEWRTLCLGVLKNLPVGTPVGFGDVDAILTWALPEYERLTAGRRTIR